MHQAKDVVPLQLMDCYGQEVPVIAPVVLKNVQTLPPQFACVAVSV